MTLSTIIAVLEVALSSCSALFLKGRGEMNVFVGVAGSGFGRASGTLLSEFVV